MALHYQGEHGTSQLTRRGGRFGLERPAMRLRGGGAALDVEAVDAEREEEEIFERIELPSVRRHWSWAASSSMGTEQSETKSRARPLPSPSPPAEADEHQQTSGQEQGRHLCDRILGCFPGRDAAGTDCCHYILCGFVASALAWYCFGLAFLAPLGPSKNVIAPGLRRLSHRSHPSAFYSLHAGRLIGTGVFGHVGDRAGRRVALALALLLIAGSTAAMGCFHPLRTDGLHHGPTVTTIWAVLRFLLGAGVGGHCPGTILLPLEFYRREKDGAKAAAVAHAGMPVGLALASVAAYFLLLDHERTPAFQDGLRVAYLAAGLLVPVALWAYIGGAESESFEDAHLVGNQERWQLWATFRGRGCAMLTGCLTILLDATLQCAIIFYWPILLPHALGNGGVWVNWCLAIALTITAASTLLGACLREHLLTRCTTYRLGAAVACVMMWLWFPLVRAHRRAELLVADILVLVPGLGIMQGTMAALMAEAYPTSVAYTGMAITYQGTQAVVHMVYPSLALWLLGLGESSGVKSLQVEPGVNPVLVGVLMLAVTIVALVLAGGLKGYHRGPSIARPRSLLIRECIALSTPSQ